MPALLVGLALTVRIAVVAADSGYLPEHDADDYDRHASSIAAGDGYPESIFVPDGGPSALRPPGYPYLLGALYALSGDSIAVGRAANVVLGALAVLMLYLIASSIWGRRVGLVTAGLAAVFPPLVLLSRDLLSESLFLVLMLAAVLCVLSFRRTGTVRWAAAAGAICGLAALTRNPGIVLVVPAAIGVWMLRPRLSLRSMAAPALLLGCAVMMIAPWTLRNSGELGRFVPITSSVGFALAGAYNQVSLDDERYPGSFRTPVVVPEYEALFRTPGVDEGTLDATLRREALDFAWDHPAYIAEVTGHNLLRLFELKGGSVVGAHNVGTGRLVADPDAISEGRGIGSATPPAERAGLAVAAVFALGGAFAIGRSRRGLEHTNAGLPRFPVGPWFLWLIPVVMIAAAAPINGLPRYRVPADPFLLILAAIGLVWAWERLIAIRARRGGSRSATLAAIGAVAVLALTGCGGDDDDGEQNSAGTETATETSVATTEAEKQRYVAKVDQICRDGAREAKAIGDRFSLEGPGPPIPERITEQLVAPGIPVAERITQSVHELQPRPDDPDLEHWLSLFDPGLELLRQRLEAGRSNDLTESQRLEVLLVELGDEQRAAAQRFGLRSCERDFLTVLVSEAFG